MAGSLGFARWEKPGQKVQMCDKMSQETFEYYWCSPMTKNFTVGYVYVVRVEHGLYKVGRTRHPEKRFKQLENSGRSLGYKTQLTPIFVYRTSSHELEERIMHTLLYKKRVELGFEMFDLDEADLKHVQEHADVLGS